jgi:hypothetical protein
MKPLRTLMTKLRRLTGEPQAPPAPPPPPSPVIKHGRLQLVVMPDYQELRFFGLGLRTRDCDLCEAWVWDLGRQAGANVICPRCAGQLGLDEAQVKRSVSAQLTRRCPGG